jgi:hypothetical protein
MKAIRPTNSSSSRVRFGLLVAVAVSLAGCKVTTSTFVIQEPIERRAITSCNVAASEGTPEFESEYKADFEKKLREELRDERGFAMFDDPKDAEMKIRYRPILLNSGSSAARVGSRAAGAAASIVLPVGGAPQLGNGEVGVEAEFRNNADTVVARVLIGAPVSGMFGTTSRSLGAVAATLAEFTGQRFKTEGATGQEATPGAGIKQFMPTGGAASDESHLQPFVGVWDETWEIGMPGQPPETIRSQLTVTWEGNRHALLQQRLLTQGSAAVTWIAITAWDRKADAFRTWAYDPGSGNFQSHLMRFDSSSGAFKILPQESEEGRVRGGEVKFSDDGNSRQSTMQVQTIGGGSAVMELRCEAHKRGSR